ncbi:DUF547 domain-containing protein [Candidatus Poribacteria bacterium]|nr:DUF547 domain-containing protein [Candidatus Poribacteria bacterium]
MKNRIFIILLIPLSLIGIIILYNFRIEIDARSLDAISEKPFSHDKFNQVLGSHVNNGRIDYAKLKDNPNIFDSYLDELAIVDPTMMSFNEQLTFWINAYNALIIKGVIDHYPTESVLKIKLFRGFFSRLKFHVAKNTYTLNQIEHDILRAEFVDPRIHFALVCASLSCPTIENTVFQPDIIEEQLDEVTEKFINNPKKVRIDRKNRTVYLSKIFKWYKEDFTEGYDGVPDFLADYLPPEDAEFIVEKNIKFHYLNYDWSLNDKK